MTSSSYTVLRVAFINQSAVTEDPIESIAIRPHL